ncbi:MAG: GTP-binding protein [Nanoarchaeota archaeon]|nr:GTP-binding protein [Nanoarchaeota archaeon]
MSKQSFFSRFISAFKIFFKRKKKLALGIYGPTNAGKTTLANKISMDWTGEEVGAVSRIPHETRRVQNKENVLVEWEGKKLVINLIDTPGIATRVDYEDFIKFKLKKKESQERAREATQGIIEAIKWLDNMECVLAVMDATKNPLTQVNLTILGNLEARGIPVIIVANKIDLKKANLKRIESAFPQYTVVGISAKDGKNIEGLYKAIFDTA